MATFCLVKPIADKFAAAIKDGTVNPEKLASMSSEERNKFLADIVGKDNATKVNALFESKLLLKNQQAGMVAWAKKMLDMSPTVRQDLISKITRLDRVLSETEQKAFLGDLAETRLGVNVTKEEANKIADMTKKMTDLQKATENGGDRMAYGRARVDLTNYVSDLKNEANKFKLGDLVKNPGRAISGVGGFTKSLKASLDNSAIFRQGWTTMFTHPDVWTKNAAKSFEDIVKTIGGKEVMREVHADILSRPTYQKMKDAHLAVSVREEAFPSSAPEKIPFLGKIYKASETAYTAFLDRTRADVFDKYLQVAEHSGINTEDPAQLRGMGKLVNSLTGRGSMGNLENSADVVNNIFFSARSVKSQWDRLTLHTPIPGLREQPITPFARKQAAINLVRQVAGMALILGSARALKPDSVQLDPRSSDFGKIKIGNTRFDVSGGQSSLVVLAARLLSGSTKSSTTGNVSKLNTGKFGSQTRLTVAENFLINKLAPVPSVIKDIFQGQDFSGNKPTLSGELQNLLVPLPITNYQSMLKDPGSANKVLSVILDGLGIAANDYAPKPPKPTKTKK